jgi:hypothetical protein
VGRIARLIADLVLVLIVVDVALWGIRWFWQYEVGSLLKVWKYIQALAGISPAA